MANYYEFLKIAPNATLPEVETAIDAQYNQWRRLTTHHDVNIAKQANQALTSLEQIRSILLNAEKRRIYDSGLGLIGEQLGGLADLEAITLNTSLKSAGMDTPPASHPVTVPGWICKNCKTMNQAETRFCTKCGSGLAFDCPKCQKLLPNDLEFCPNCGVNVAEALEALRIENQRLEKENEKQKLLAPIKNGAASASSWASPWWWIIIGMYGIIWLVAIRKANNALNLPIIPGDELYREQARKAKKTATVNFFLLVIGGVIALMIALASSQ